MRTQDQRTTAGQSAEEAGFTLVELLGVMVIVMILAGLVLGTARHAQRKAVESRAQSEITAMETALESYRIDKGFYPAGTSSTAIYNALAGGAKTYMAFRPAQLSGAGASTVIIDPFGKAYFYVCPGVLNSASFDLWSGGQDKQNGTVDDIANFAR